LKQGHELYEGALPLCDRQEILLVGGATISVNGVFRVCCIGELCSMYPCDQVQVKKEKKE
jgi:hypothetical protein